MTSGSPEHIVEWEGEVGMIDKLLLGAEVRLGVEPLKNSLIHAFRLQKSPVLNIKITRMIYDVKY